jgi:hypothetical protein
MTLDQIFEVTLFLGICTPVTFVVHSREPSVSVWPFPFGFASTPLQQDVNGPKVLPRFSRFYIRV